MLNPAEEVVLGGDHQAESRSTRATPGEVLADARQKLGLSVGDIAAKLRMSVVQIDAMEKADYARLPKGTFLRGFVRSYAKLVGLSPEAVLQILEETHPDSRKPSIVVPTQNIAMKVPGERYYSPKVQWLLVLTLVLAVAAGGAYWWFEVRPGKVAPVALVPAKPPAETGTVSVAAPAASAPSGQSASDPSAPPVESTASTGATAGTGTQQVAASGNAQLVEPTQASPQVAPLTQTTAPLQAAPAAAQAAAAKPVVPKGSGSLRFVFSGESWVEVVDAAGKTLVSRRYQSGQSETVVGKLPLSVVIGNATVTRMQFNDVDFDLTPHTRVAVARFTLK